MTSTHTGAAPAAPPSALERVRPIAERAIAERLGQPFPDGILDVRQDAEDDHALIVHVNSGGNAIVVEIALTRAGYDVVPLADVDCYGVLLAVRVSADRPALDSATAPRQLIDLFIETRDVHAGIRPCLDAFRPGTPEERRCVKPWGHFAGDGAGARWHDDGTGAWPAVGVNYPPEASRPAAGFRLDRPATVEDFDSDALIERMIEELADKDLAVDGEEWWVAQTADPFEFTITTYEGEMTPTRRLRVRLTVDVAEESLP